MPNISDELRKEAGEAFHAFEKVYIERIVRRPGWRLDAQPLEDVLAAGDEQKVRDFIADMRRGRDEMLNAHIVW